MIEVILFLIGLVVASFIYTTTERNTDKSKKTYFSHCNKCQKRLFWYELIPIFSYLIQLGKCRKCQVIIPIIYPVFELLFGVLFYLFYRYFGFNWQLIWFYALFSLLFYISYYDILTQEISEKTIVVLLTIILVEQLISKSIGLNSLYGALMSGFIIFLFNYFSKGKAMGFGDVELALVLGFWLKLKFSLIFILIAFILGGIYGAIILVLKFANLKDKIAFVPFMTISSLIVYFWGDIIHNFFFF